LPGAKDKNLHSYPCKRLVAKHEKARTAAILWLSFCVILFVWTIFNRTLLFEEFYLFTKDYVLTCKEYIIHKKKAIKLDSWDSLLFLLK